MNNEEKNISVETEMPEENNDSPITTSTKKLSGGVIGAIIGGAVAVIAIIILLTTLLFGNNNSGNPGDNIVTYTVTVVDENNNPVKDVVITFTTESGESDMKVTKADGKLTYEPAEKFTASVTRVPNGYKDDLVGQTISFDEQGNATIALKKNVTEAVKEDYVILVVDQDGNPIEGVFVQMCTDVCLSPKTTGADGKVIYNVVPDSYKAQLTDLPDGYTVDDITAKYEFVDGMATIVLTKVN